MLNITIDKVRHIEDKDANVRETLVELQHAPKNSSLAAYNAILNGYGILIILLS